ncbi:MAG: DUF4124 domain-containing protein [Rudaea sp.]|nr:DUF4124 domain-containing protein [Rudaea sp.]
MGKIEFEARGRSMRWYEWLSLLFLLGLAVGARADSVYKCTDTQGAITFQAQTCPAQDTQSSVTIAPAPAHAKPPEYALDKNLGPTREAPRERNTLATQRADERLQQISYECRVSDGEVFYRHTPCPHSLPADGGAHSGKARDRRSGQSLVISARKVPREEACMQMRRPGAIGRAGREHDEDVSTYERNLGRDPCR